MADVKIELRQLVADTHNLSFMAHAPRATSPEIFAAGTRFIIGSYSGNDEYMVIITGGEWNIEIENRSAVAAMKANSEVGVPRNFREAMMLSSPYGSSNLAEAVIDRLLGSGLIDMLDVRAAIEAVLRSDNR